MIRRLLVMTAAVVVAGSFALPAVAAPAPPGFKLVLTSSQTAVPAGAGQVRFAIWNEAADGVEPVPITVTTSATWATPAPASFVLASGTHQDIVVTLAASAQGKALVTFSTAPGSVGSIRVIRAVAAPIWVGIAPPRPVVAQPLNTPGFDWLRPDWRLIGLVGAIMAIVRLAAVIRRRRATR